MFYYWGLDVVKKLFQVYDNKCQQAGAELGQAQPQLGFWELFSFSLKVEN